MEENTCPICLRQLAEPSCRHHLIPLSQGGKGDVTFMMHKICHGKVHSIFNEKELARTYTSIEKILENEELQKFVTDIVYRFHDTARWFISYCKTTLIPKKGVSCKSYCRSQTVWPMNPARL